MAISHRAGRVVDFVSVTMIWGCVLWLPLLFFASRDNLVPLLKMATPVAIVFGFIAERRHNRRSLKP
jgi:hypothetical protein